MTAEMERLTTEVEEEKTLTQSAITLLTTLADEIRANLNDKQALTELADELDANQADLAAAITANTPAEGTE